MRNAVDHVFVDCGPVGLAGRGGHGHNDCLAFEAALDGVQLVTDCGLFVYTASFAERNHFRSTAYHNTPLVDGAEINRIDPKLLWLLHYDARPDPRRFETGSDRDVFEGAHPGYAPPPSPVAPVRTIKLDHARHALEVRDAFEGAGRHRIEIPLHLATGVEARQSEPGVVELRCGSRRFRLDWQPVAAWSLEIGTGRVSPSYGIALPIVRLLWRRDGPLEPASRGTHRARGGRLTGVERAAPTVLALAALAAAALGAVVWPRLFDSTPAGVGRLAAARCEALPPSSCQVKLLTLGPGRFWVEATAPGANALELEFDLPPSASPPRALLLGASADALAVAVARSPDASTWQDVETRESGGGGARRRVVELPPGPERRTAASPARARRGRERAPARRGGWPLRVRVGTRDRRARLPALAAGPPALLRPAAAGLPLARGARRRRGIRPAPGPRPLGSCPRSSSA